MILFVGGVNLVVWVNVFRSWQPIQLGVLELVLGSDLELLHETLGLVFLLEEHLRFDVQLLLQLSGFGVHSVDVVELLVQSGSQLRGEEQSGSHGHVLQLPGLGIMDQLFGFVHNGELVEENREGNQVQGKGLHLVLGDCFILQDVFIKERFLGRIIEAQIADVFEKVTHV